MAKRKFTLREFTKLKAERKRRGGEGRKVLSQRATRTRRLLTALSPGGEAQRSGPGRPRGTYKHGMPIHVYKKLQARQRALFRAYQMQNARKLAGRGLTPAQVQQAQLQRTLDSPPEATTLPPQGFPSKPQQAIEVMDQADDDLKFRKFLSASSISPRTQQILLQLRKTQLKSKRDDLENQRRIMERKLVGEAGNLLSTPFIFKDHDLDMTGVDGDNILKSPPVFKENPENNILRSRGRNILDLRENQLRF